MAVFLEDIGDSQEIINQIGKVLLGAIPSLSLVLDKPRTLTDFTITSSDGKNQNIVRCSDAEERTTVVLYLPKDKNARAHAIIISHEPQEES